MKKFLFLNVLILAALISSSLAASVDVVEEKIVRFDGSKVLRVQATTTEQYKILLDLSNRNGGNQLDFWTEPALNDFTDIMVSKSHFQELDRVLTNAGMSYKIHIDDVQKIIDEQKAADTAAAELNGNTRAMSWDAYQTIATIYEWLDSLAIQYPTLVTQISVGTSTEGREIKVVKISTGGGANKIGFWIDATIHAREWVATSTATYIINELVTNSASYADILEVIDFYFLPIVNPDGYAYTHQTNRMWRKTRSQPVPGSGCRGVDANRNFGHAFGGPGSSADPCSETYRGPAAYSEPEADALKNYINSLNSTANWQTFITLHSYSQLWMTPWGYTEDLPEDYDELLRVADRSVAALTSVYGTRYTTGSSANVLYHSSGSSRDWAKGLGGFKYVYTIELRDTGAYGFLLPPAQILPTAIETWTGIQVTARNHLTQKIQ